MTNYERRLRAAIETERTVRFWGYDYRITPAFVVAKLGDGLGMLAVQPLNTRPNFYVIRVHSGWLRDDDRLCDHMDDIIDAIIDEYSDIEREREYLIEDGVDPEDADLNGHEDRLGWPVFSGDSGYCWWERDWPDGFGPGSRRRKPARAAGEGS